MAEYDLLIINGVLVTDEELGDFDIAVKNEKIEALRPRGGFSGVKAERTIDAEGGYVMPGEATRILSRRLATDRGFRRR